MSQQYKPSLLFPAASSSQNDTSSAEDITSDEQQRESKEAVCSKRVVRRIAANPEFFYFLPTSSEAAAASTQNDDMTLHSPLQQRSSLSKIAATVGDSCDNQLKSPLSETNNDVTTASSSSSNSNCAQTPSSSHHRHQGRRITTTDNVLFRSRSDVTLFSSPFSSGREQNNLSASRSADADITAGSLPSPSSPSRLSSFSGFNDGCPLSSPATTVSIITSPYRRPSALIANHVTNSQLHNHYRGLTGGEYVPLSIPGTPVHGRSVTVSTSFGGPSLFLPRLVKAEGDASIRSSLSQRASLQSASIISSELCGNQNTNRFCSYIQGCQTPSLLALPFHVITSAILSFLDARESCRLLQLFGAHLLEVGSQTTCVSDKLADCPAPDPKWWDLWDTNKDGGGVSALSPSQFLGKPAAFFDPVQQQKSGAERWSDVCHHICIGEWWNHISAKADNQLTRFLSQSNLKTLKVESGFYACPCVTCSRLRPSTNELTIFAVPSSIDNSGRPPSDLLLLQSIREGNDWAADGDRPLLHRMAALTGSSLQTSSWSSSSSSSGGSPTNIRGQQREGGCLVDILREEPAVETDSISLRRLLPRTSGTDEFWIEREMNSLSPSSRDPVGHDGDWDSENEAQDDLTIPEFIPRPNPCDPTSTASFSLAVASSTEYTELPYLTVAKRHACARFLWVTRLMFACRKTLEEIDIEGIPEYLQTMSDDADNLPQSPIDLKALETKLEFPNLRKLRFGLTLDCRFLIPLLDFCSYPLLYEVGILGLSLHYESLPPQFGTEPTMVFAPKQIFSKQVDDIPQWMPAVYNGPVDDLLRLQGKGVYVSREYWYEGGFKNGQNDGWGKMVSKCGEIYEGNWSGGRRHGYGRVHQANGKQLEGQWVRDVLTGRGSMQMADGLRYQGEWLNGSLDGWGVLSRNKRLLAVGQFSEGKAHGWMRGRLCCLEPDDVQIPSNPTLSEFVERESDSISDTRTLPDVIAYELLDEHDSDISFEPEDTLPNMDSVIDALVRNRRVKSSAPCTTSKLAALCGMPDWRDVCRVPIDRHAATSLQLLRQPQKPEELLLLNPLLMQQEAGIKPHAQRRRGPTDFIPHIIPEWVELLVEELCVT